MLGCSNLLVGLGKEEEAEDFQVQGQSSKMMLYKEERMEKIRSPTD